MAALRKNEIRGKAKRYVGRHLERNHMATQSKEVTDVF
jgi:hypothetical protein